MRAPVSSELMGEACRYKRVCVGVCARVCVQMCVCVTDRGVSALKLSPAFAQCKANLTHTHTHTQQQTNHRLLVPAASFSLDWDTASQLLQALSTLNQLGLMPVGSTFLHAAQTTPAPAVSQNSSRASDLGSPDSSSSSSRGDAASHNSLQGTQHNTPASSPNVHRESESALLQLMTALVTAWLSPKRTHTQPNHSNISAAIGSVSDSTVLSAGIMPVHVQGVCRA